MSKIPMHKSSDPTEDLQSALDEAGCRVGTDMSDGAARDRVRSDLEPHMPEAAGLTMLDDPDSFYPGCTRRTTGLIARSEQAREFAVHPVSRALYDHHLGAHCEHVRLHVTAGLEVGPRARKQILHREEDPFSFFPLPRPHLILASMWAISDFRADNGGTQLVPGSHRWEADREAQPDEIALAAMPITPTRSPVTSCDFSQRAECQ